MNNGNINAGNNYNNINVDNGWNNGWGGGYYGGRGFVAGAVLGAAVVGTAYAVGTSFYALPSGCGLYGSSIYYYCGGVYYQPVYSGSDVTYVVVDHPG